MTEHSASSSRVTRLTAAAGRDVLLEELYVHQAELEIQNEELRAAQVALEQSRGDYMALFDAMPVACLTLSPAGVVMEANRRAESLFGLVRSRLKGRPLLRLLESEHSRVQGHMLQVRAGGLPHRGEYRFKGPGGQNFDGVLELALVAAGSDRLGTMLCTVVDLSERIRAAQELARANGEIRRAKARAEKALAVKTRFIATASHDLRQPVQALSLFIEVLAKRTENDAGLSTVVGRVQEATGSLRELLNGLLDISKLEAGLVVPEFQDFDVSEMLGRLAREFASVTGAKGLGLRLRVQAPLRVCSDLALLERVVRNMVANATRYTGQGAILLAARQRAGRVRIEVWDTGIGIPEDQLQLIFDDFHQVHNEARNSGEGLGLGLAIVHRLAQLLGGHITVRSRVGHGSLFAIEVPLAGSDEALTGLPGDGVGR